MSRKVTAHMFHSLNGVVEHPNLWQFDAFGPEEGEAMGEALAPVTDVVIGRKLWQEWSEFWGESDDPFAQWINPARKHVISQTLPDELSWNSTRITTDPIDYVKQLRGQGEGDISVVGGIETIRSLFLAGQIDELTLTTHPVIADKGRRLFDDTSPMTRLQLLNVKQTSVGNAVLTYGLRPAD